VRASEGSLRDALSLLDTAIAYGEGKLDEASVAQLLGASSPVHVRAFVEALLARDGGAALGAIDRAAEAGEDLGGLCREVVEVARRLLVLKAAPSASLPDLTVAETEALRSAAAPVSVDEVIYLLRAFLDADAEMRRSPHPRVELEIAAVRTTRRPEPQMLDALLAKVEDALAQFRAGAPAAAPASRAAIVQDSLLATASPTIGPAPSPRPVAPAATPVSPPERERPDPRPMREPAAPERVEPREDPVLGPTGDLEESWQRVIAEVMKKKALVGSVLQGATPLGVEAGVLMLALTGNHFHRDRLAEPGNREVINQAVQQLIPGARRFEIDAGGAGAGGARNHPAVQAALNVFQGEVVAVRPRAPEEGESS
jgi:DNA polymerase-3 subunit gamma/tau